MNRRGMFFTIIAISLISLFVLIYVSYSSIDAHRKSVGKRIETMNNFVFSLEQDLPRQMYIAGYRAIFLFENRIAEKGEYISNLNSTFAEVFFNGTLYGSSQELMIGAKFSDFQNSINERADMVNLNVTFSESSVRISQDDSWRIKITLSTRLFIEDRGKLASWNRTGEFYTYIPIDNFDDPVYTVSTNGKVINRINNSVNLPFVSGTNVANLSIHLQNSRYVNSSSAPSFVMRLEGNFGASPQGIESLVYLPRLSAQGIGVADKTCVDYVYFSADDPASHKISGMPSWFKIDNDHLNIYQVSGLAI